jgi:ChaB/Rho termination factor, N-terminal domain
MPGTIRRSDSKAQRTWAKAHDSAVETYGEGRRSHQTAFAALKHTHEKKGDRWVPKSDSGPSDKQAERGARDRPTKTAGGVDANASKQHLLKMARDLDISGRSTMNKDELVSAIKKANDKATRQKQPSSKKK